MKLFISHSPEQTREIARHCLTVISFEKSADEATVVGLSGHLGSGKTAFAQAVAAELGVVEQVTSPTFVIMKLYDPKIGPWKKLVHIDAYRLEEGRELAVLGFEDIVADEGNLILIEWMEKVKEILPNNTRLIEFEAVGENDRSIHMSDMHK
ncbi:tRNA (adenosine(37)-N6)-threonylcarbamoyltransferase complex ATPase subunit type 1 TsaE [Patescibacteria group bacterium]|nr:tRNA (adenosine(37)-N6)-threonylcarbamoyltransferase complex ATPase subunit type 1 TsaE [Patescibacteria group bacterium]MDE1946630.1 tRNA (adenosine(37)-N6)-threonylcarbamoyltransferase complex ATPase subunit type 1 TsaE [Patescibacteria group bacterium]MDE2010584.1 tRNA (adenosine(37)-N6)-threonylcarbamoyltransferase complex ATPase subunit type 1 TsaE [Patescibacteria group bacterium]MDE2233173.1 tRNA (adenosine(37)-N6)-threonylcarbamoyltransferase complex ATPase subunit type 1 TsaE [Patesc